MLLTYERDTPTRPARSAWRSPWAMRATASRPGPADCGARIRGAMTITVLHAESPPAGILPISHINQARDALSARSRASVRFAGRAGRDFERFAAVCASAELRLGGV